jgi:uncharacterized protein
MNENFELYCEIAKEIIFHSKFESQKNYFHHKTSLYEHAISVSYYSFLIAKKLKFDVRSVVRGALLHDFFLYDWRKEGRRIRKKLFKKHGFTHAKTAYQNAIEYFELNEKEKDIILKHMFPLNIKPPIYKESWLVNLVDNFVTFKEYFKAKKNFRLFRYIENKKINFHQ